MVLLERFGRGLQTARKSKGLSQEDFSVVSSRTYLSSLERGLKSPTITKLEELAGVLEIHPLSLLALAYLPKQLDARAAMCQQICKELELLGTRA
jgi:transcriptional regulator with XRE-family HTH domain